jgi:hypothetical protein
MQQKKYVCIILMHEPRSLSLCRKKWSKTDTLPRNLESTPEELYSIQIHRSITSKKYRGWYDISANFGYYVTLLYQNIDTVTYTAYVTVSRAGSQFMKIIRLRHGTSNIFPLKHKRRHILTRKQKEEKNKICRTK